VAACCAPPVVCRLWLLVQCTTYAMYSGCGVTYQQQQQQQGLPAHHHGSTTAVERFEMAAYPTEGVQALCDCPPISPFHQTCCCLSTTYERLPAVAISTTEVDAGISLAAHTLAAAKL
jgi:hypothetical protein